MKLLALVDSPDHVCCRYRIRAFAPAMERAGIGVDYRALGRGPFERVRQLVASGRFDAVILQRKLLPGWQLGILRRAARRLIFDFDDAVLYRDSNDPRGPEDGRRRRRFAATVAAADAVLAGNDFLADCALRAGARVQDVHVIPTCVEPERYPKASVGIAEGPIDLVWIGTGGTLKGLLQPREVWASLARNVPGLRLRVICDRFPEDFPIPIVPVAWSEAEEARQIAAGDVGVSWLPDDLWSRGKCGLKILQYQAAGLPVVANAVGCQVEMVRPGSNGFLADDATGWVEAMGRLMRDPELRRRMGEASRRDVERNYSVSAWSEAFVQSIQGRPRPALSGPHAARVRSSAASLQTVGDSI